MIPAFEGRFGVLIPRAPLYARLGAKGLRGILLALTVTEKVCHGRPKHMGRVVRHAYAYEKNARGDFLVIPRAAARLLALRKIISLPLPSQMPPARPATPAATPATTTARPTTATARPATTAARPATTAATPATPTARPATPTARPATTAARPATTAARPATPAARPATPTARPMTTTARPATPATPAARPATPAARPATPAAQPAAQPAAPPLNPPLPPPRRVEFKLEVEPFAYQTAAIAHVCDHFATNTEAYLKMAAGLGKTITSCGIAARLGVPVLVSVPTEGLASQWVDEIRLALPRARCAVYRNPPKDSRKVPPNASSHDIVIVIINTLRTKKPEFLEGYGLVVFDEAHELHSAENSKALWLAQTRYVLGLSATPRERKPGDGEGRKDGLDVLVIKHLGPVIYEDKIPGFDAGEANFTGTVRRIVYSGHPDHCETAVVGGATSAIMTIANIMRDPHRLRLVAQQIAWLYNLHKSPEAAEYGLGVSPGDPPNTPPRRHGVFAFAEHREMLPALQAELRRVLPDADIAVEDDVVDDAKKVGDDAKTSKNVAEPARSVSILRGGVARDELGKVRGAGAHIVLTTYGYSRRGISLRDMTAMVLVSPRRNGMNQLNGRIRRRGSDPRIVRIVVDIVDDRTFLKTQSAERNKSYKQLNYPIKTAKVSYDQIDVGVDAKVAPAAKNVATAAAKVAQKKPAGKLDICFLDLADDGGKPDGDEPDGASTDDIYG